MRIMFFWLFQAVISSEIIFKSILLENNERIRSILDSISNLVVNGSRYIDDGDDYELNIFCSGSPNFEYCVRQIDGPYIMEGNETCDDWTTMEECQQNHKFPQGVLNVKSFTVLVIVRNSVSIERKLFVVNIKQPIILIATMVSTVVFTLCIIAVVSCCLVRCIRKKKRLAERFESPFPIISSFE